ncbi:MAG: TIGR03087 family PEP-CTERM/XrtA system glycosyltransferase [Desulfocapsaceae bacterium]|nr:TIGR03087 family PEP-CTERM/XrtA system glycosyltransferase [Desulfocapsaceae bacterium]
MSATNLKILYLAHRVPFPPNKGDKIRSFNEIKYLSQEHEIHLACLIDDPKDVQHVSGLERFVRTIDYVLISPFRQKLKALHFFLTGQPLSVPYFYSSELQTAVDKRLAEIDFDVIFCFSSPMAEYVFKSRHYRDGRLGRARLIMDFVDVDSDKWRMYAGFSSFPFSLIYHREWLCLQKYDARVGRAFSRSIFVSEKEVELYRSFCPDADSQAIANGVDQDFFAVTENMRSEACKGASPATLLFMGAMDYYPNVDAVVYFAEDIWPMVKEKIPTAQFIIAGSNPTARVRDLARRDRSITVTGAVPDIRRYLAQADIFIAPFRIARGIQNKILEAMAAGVAVVARPEAVQGFGRQPSCITVATNADDFASAVLALLMNENARAAITQEAKEFVCSTFCWQDNMNALQRILLM